MEKYYKNFILCGELDYYCLLCKEYFMIEEHVEKHIRWEKHRKEVKNKTIYSRLRKDFIYKAGFCFYCEICNYLTPKEEMIHNHVTDEKHLANKDNRGNTPSPKIQFRRVINEIKFPTFSIPNNQWHGLLGSNCIVCNVEVSKIMQHKSLPSHIINLIQSKVHCEDDFYFRELKNGKAFCFECQTVFASDKKTEHRNTECIRSNKPGNKKIITVQENEIYPKDIWKSYIKNERKKKSYFDYDSILENNKLTCQKCKAIVKNDKYIQKCHIATHKNDEDKEEYYNSDDDTYVRMKNYDHGKERSLLAKFGKQNHIKLNCGGSKAYCLICDMFLSPDKSVFQQHIKGIHHSFHLELLGEKEATKHTKPMHKYVPIQQYVRAVSTCRLARTFILNEAFVIRADALFFLSYGFNGTRTYTTVKCHLCNISFPMNNKLEHCKSVEHIELFLKAHTVSSLPGEFIREMRPNVYHCGACNLVFPYWELMAKHINTKEHEELRNNCNLEFKVAKKYDFYTIVTKLNETSVKKIAELMV